MKVIKNPSNKFRIHPTVKNGSSNDETTDSSSSSDDNSTKKDHHLKSSTTIISSNYHNKTSPGTGKSSYSTIRQQGHTFNTNSSNSNNSKYSCSSPEEETIDPVGDFPSTSRGIKVHQSENIGDTYISPYVCNDSTFHQYCTHGAIYSTGSYHELYDHNRDHLEMKINRRHSYNHNKRNNNHHHFRHRPYFISDKLYTFFRKNDVLEESSRFSYRESSYIHDHLENGGDDSKSYHLSSITQPDHRYTSTDELRYHNSFHSDDGNYYSTTASEWKVTHRKSNHTTMRYTIAKPTNVDLISVSRESYKQPSLTTYMLNNECVRVFDQ